MRIEEASYGRIYQHTRDNGTFAIIGSEDKDTHKSRYEELKSLIKEYEKKYGHLGYNRLSGTYQYQLTGEKVSEKSVIIYDIELKDALSIAKKINQESIIWKENTFFGIIDVQGGVLERFKKSALNFSKAIKNGIGSKLMSDQTRDFGYAFEEVKLMRKNNLSENILTEINKEDRAYLEWYQVCEAFCKKIGAELLFVNSDSFGYEDKNGNLIHMYADELEQYLKTEKQNEKQSDHYGLEDSDGVIEEAAEDVDKEYLSFKKDVLNIFEMFYEDDDMEYAMEVAGQNLFDVLYYAIKKNYDTEAAAMTTANDLTNYLLDAAGHGGELSWQNDKAIREVYDQYVLNKKDIKEGVETKAGNDFDEVASYMYNEANGDIDYIPSFEQTNDYIASVTKREYNNLYKAVKTAIENVADNMYDGYIELSDRATISSLYGDKLEDADPEEAMALFGMLRDEAFKQFEDETKTEIWQEGRSGRHIVVKDNYLNAVDYDYLCRVQKRLEDWVIAEFAREMSNDNIEESVETIDRGPIGNIKYGKYGKYYVALSNEGVSLYKKDPLEFEKNFKGEDFTDAFDTFDKENLIKGYEVGTPEYKKIKDSLKESLKESDEYKEPIKVCMNTWANYNSYNRDLAPMEWMTIDEALVYCDKYSEQEPFINDYENSPIKLSEYDNPWQMLKLLKEVEESPDSLIMKNALEVSDEGDYEDVIQKIKDGEYVWFEGCEDDFDLGKDYVDMLGSHREVANIENYFMEDEFRNAIEDEEKDYFASEHGIDTDDPDFPEDEFEEWMDEVVRSEIASFGDIADHDNTYFDYNQLGEDLEWDGYKFTSDGCIQIQ